MKNAEIMKDAEKHLKRERVQIYFWLACVLLFLVGLFACIYLRKDSAVIPTAINVLLAFALFWKGKVMESLIKAIRVGDRIIKESDALIEEQNKLTKAQDDVIQNQDKIIKTQEDLLKSQEDLLKSQKKEKEALKKLHHIDTSFIQITQEALRGLLRGKRINKVDIKAIDSKTTEFLETALKKVKPESEKPNQ